MSPAFSNGARVSSRSNVHRKGKVDKAYPLQGGYQYYDVIWDDGDLETVSEDDLMNEVIIKTPWHLLTYNSLSDYKFFSIATTIHKVKNTTSNTISTLKASRTLFKPYQYKPLVKFLNSSQNRILIADEVGLGKTIEAGHIMLELAARNKLKSGLIICTKSLMDKWQTELLDKFNFFFKKYETVKDLVQDIANDFAVNKGIFGILNYEKCRSEELSNIILKNSYQFDLLVCDEAHKIRNRETGQHKGVAKLVDQSKAVIFMTATPIMTDIRNLHNLIRVLDKEAYDTFDIFNNAVNQNRPFIKALSELNSNNSLEEIAQKLHSASVVQEMTIDNVVYSRKIKTVEEIFDQDELYNRARANMLSGDTGVENKVKVQQDLIELNSLNHLYTRTRKKDVLSGKDIVVRNPHTYSVRLSVEERELYDDLIESYDDENSLGLIQHKRQMTSSIVAYKSKRADLENGKYLDVIEDSKFNMFKRIIDEVVHKQNKKIIVFAYFTNTLLYLRLKLAELNINSEIIYGDIKNRSERLEWFQNDENIKVLLSSEVGSEGIDLQFCDCIVNYDLPWNPMVVEQRIGRIDRVGQESSIIHIYNLIIEDTIESRIYERLYQRIQLFKESIGDLEEILGEKEDINIEEEIVSLYKTRLSEEEQLKKLEQLVYAIENERQNLVKIKAELESAFANDFYFQQEIENITTNNRYLTPFEIITYIDNAITLYLTTLQFVQINDKEFEIRVPSGDKATLFEFIEINKDRAIDNPELENLYRKFKTKYSAVTNVKVTFDQEHAYKNKSVEFLSAFHPLVNAITNFFQAKGYDKNQAHKVSVRKHNLSINIDPGFYLMAIYRISVKKITDGKETVLHFLKSATVDINGSEPILIEKKDSDYLLGAVPVHGEMFSEDVEFYEEMVDAIRSSISSEILSEQRLIKEDEELKFYSSINRRANQEINFINTRIKRIERQLESKTGVEAILRKEYENYKQQEKELREAQKKARLDVGHSLISVNLIQIK